MLTRDALTITKTDRAILRDLATRLRDIGNDPIQEKRKALWKAHNGLKQARPIVYLSPEGSWRELVPRDTLSCENPALHDIEHRLRMAIYQHEHFHDDVVAEAVWEVYSVVRSSGWGLEAEREASSETHGAWAFVPVLQNQADVKKLKLPVITYDEAATQERMNFAQDLFGDLLAVQQRKVNRISYHLMKQYTALRGLEQTFMDMYENPQLIHDVMQVFVEGHQSMLRQYQEQDLLDRNDDNTYHNSGGRGWIDGLVPEGATKIRPCDMWGSAEDQELAVVSPEQHEEFCLQYVRPLLEPFAINGYGCCEDLTEKLDLVFKIKNIRRISVCPWADVRRCAEQMGSKYIFSWKPHPTHMAEEFNEDRIRSYIRNTLEIAQEHNLFLEMILKDTHTCMNHPERFDHWARIAREEIRELGFDIETYPFDD